MKNLSTLLFIVLLPIGYAAPQNQNSTPASQPPQETVKSHYGVDWDAIAAAPTHKGGDAPIYPFTAAREQKSGTVKIVFQIDAKGRAQDVRAFDATRPDFEKAAISAVTKWKFPPQAGGPYRLFFTFTSSAAMSGEVSWK